MLTGSAETPSVIDIRTSNSKPQMRIENANQSGLKQPCYMEYFMQITALYAHKMTIEQEPVISLLRFDFELGMWDQSSKSNNFSATPKT